jgi:VWFA-related protein
MPGRYSLLVGMAVLGIMFGQETQTTPDLRIRVSVDLVQIDVTVTGSKGEHVPGLTKDDFELFLDGNPQPITNFGYAALPASSRPMQSRPLEAPVYSSKPAAIPPSPEVRLQPGRVRRAVALFVDDISMSAESVPFVRNGLRKAIETEIGPGDLAAVIRARAGMGALQDFTTDKQRLLAAADQVHWYPGGRGELSAYDRILGPVEGGAQASLVSAQSGDQRDVAESNFRKKYFLGASIDALRRVVSGMADLPGRKAVVVLSDNLTVAFRDPGSPDAQPAMHVYEEDHGIMDQLRRCADAAVRSGVVIYGVDTRGLASLRALAADNLDHPERFRLPGGVTPDSVRLRNRCHPGSARGA